uniref:Uncharacterized protein n=1 Tax=Timema genevievae TaxID=629358 RepID=A0A7R9K5U8_TIMGE|nr:unnamed protein product [Timema genevievae]
METANRKELNKVRRAVGTEGERRLYSRGAPSTATANDRMLQSAYETRMEDGFLEILKGKNNLLVSLRGYPQGLFCINIEYYKNDDEESRLTFERIRECELALRDSVASVRSKRFPPLRRGAPVDVYLTTAESKENASNFKLKLNVSRIRKKQKFLDERGDVDYKFDSPETGFRVQVFFSTLDLLLSELRNLADRMVELSVLFSPYLNPTVDVDASAIATHAEAWKAAYPQDLQKEDLIE